MPQKNPYDTLTELSKRANTLEGISRLLNWDQETYMPKDAAPSRGEQLKLIAELTHAIKTGPEFEKALKAVKPKTLTAKQQAALKVYKHDFMREKTLPSAFVQEFAHHISKAVISWQKARHAASFSQFLPDLKKSVELFKKKASYIGYKEHPYDALLDEFEPGVTTKEVDAIFKEMRRDITALVKKCKPTKKKAISLPCTVAEEMEICSELLHDIGFDFNRGRLDASTHPFSTAPHPYDSRITCRNESDGVVIQILTTLHEAGHGLYEMGLPIKEVGTPLGQPISLGIHESQSRFWETRIGRSKGFWKFMLPKLKKRFKKELDKVSLDDFMLRLNSVEPSFIRVNADEVTYPLHVILRFEIEKELITDKLAVKDIPKRWNSLSKELFGITPPNDAVGCLQDIHWSAGLLGYFPTYSLGNIYAAQMFEAFSKKHPKWEKMIEKGEFSFIHDWLQDNVWQHGRRYDGNELIRLITKKPLSAKPFITYLTEKYV